MSADVEQPVRGVATVQARLGMGLQRPMALEAQLAAGPVASRRPWRWKADLWDWPA